MNPWLDFVDLLPSEPIFVGLVITHIGLDRSRVELPTGEQIIVHGKDVDAGNWCYIRNGRVQGPAPNITVVEVTV